MQLIPGLLLDVGGIGVPLLLRLQVLDLSRVGLLSGQQLVDLLSLRDVLPHRVGQAERDRADHHREQRRPARQLGRAGRTGGRAASGRLGGHQASSVNLV